MSEIVRAEEMPIAAKTKKKASSSRRVATSTQVESAIDAAKAIVARQSDIIAEVYSSVPAMIELEAASKIEARWDRIQAESDRRLSETKQMIDSATSASQSIATEFLKGYGLE